MRVEKGTMLSGVMFFLSGLLLFGGTSCTGPDHSERVARVDSLKQHLKGLKERLGRIDTGRAYKVMEKAEKELELFKAHYEKDSMGEELFDVLNGYKRTEEAFEGYGGKFRKLSREFEKSNEQLKDLKADLKKGRLSKKKAESYIEDEAKVLQQLERSVGKLEKQTKAVFENYKGRPEKLREHLSLPDSVQWPGEGKQ